MHFAVSFGFCSLALSQWLRIKLHVPFFPLGQWNRPCQESRSILFGGQLVIEVVACRCRRHSHTLSSSSSIDCCVCCVSIRYWSNCAYTKERIKGIVQRDNTDYPLIVHTAALNLFDFVQIIVCRYYLSLFSLCLARTLWLKLNTAQLCSVHPSAVRMGMVMSSFSFLFHSNAVRYRDSRTSDLCVHCTPYQWVDNCNTYQHESCLSSHLLCCYPLCDRISWAALKSSI